MQYKLNNNLIDIMYNNLIDMSYEYPNGYDIYPTHAGCDPPLLTTF